MKILNRYLSHEIIGSTLFVLLGLLMLFAFFDLIGELGQLGKGGYQLPKVMLYVLLTMPGHIYELLPIAALIGTLFALSRLVQNSEFTVMRVSGLSIQQLVFSLMQVGIIFVLLTFIFGEFVAPLSERAAQQMRLKSMNTLVAQEFRSGLWVKDESSFVNVKEILPDATLIGVKIYEFDEANRLRNISFAKEGVYAENSKWRLKEVVQTHFEGGRSSVSNIPEADWGSVLTPDILNVLLVVPEQMSAWNLYSYVDHLRENQQKTTRYEIALWSKLTYPLAVMVMMLLALPFAYHQTRMGGVSAKVFSGIMLGLGFHLLNRLFAHLGLLNDWAPALSATLPTLFFLLAAIGMMWRVERR